MSRIYEHLAQCTERKVFPGAVYTVGTPETILEQGCVGYLGTGRAPVNMETLYDLASLTKPIVAMAFMKLLEEGKVCLDDTIGDYLTEYADLPKAAVTMYQLLSHTSVIPGQVQLYRTCRTKKEMLDAILYLPPRDTERMPVMYSSQGFILLGEILARIEDQPLDQVIKEKVLEPLQMTHTLYNPPETLIENIASTENCPWRGKVITGQVHDENAVIMGGVAGHAGLFADAADVGKVGRAMLTGKDARGNRYLYPSTIRLMTKNHTAGTNLARGLGWQCKDAHETPAGDLFSETSYGHTGFTGTSLWVDPERELYAVLLTNRVHPTRSGSGMARARHIFHNLAVYAWEDAWQN